MRSVLAPVVLLTLAAAQSPSREPIEGHWKNPSGTAIIAIEPCASAFCGKVAWASERGQREAAKGAPRVVGTTVLTGLKADRNRWTGTLFIPDDNMHVSAKLELVSEHKLKLTGCGLMGLICRTQVWTRFDGPLPSGD